MLTYPTIDFCFPVTYFMTSADPTSTSSGAESNVSSSAATSTSTTCNDKKPDDQGRAVKRVMSDDERTKVVKKQPVIKMVSKLAAQPIRGSDEGCIAEDFLIANTDSNTVDKDKSDGDDPPSIDKHGGWMHPLEDMHVQRKKPSATVATKETEVVVKQVIRTVISSLTRNNVVYCIGRRNSPKD